MALGLFVHFLRLGKWKWLLAQEVIQCGLGRRVGWGKCWRDHPITGVALSREWRVDRGLGLFAYFLRLGYGTRVLRFALSATLLGLAELG